MMKVIGEGGGKIGDEWDYKASDRRSRCPQPAGHS